MENKTVVINTIDWSVVPHSWSQGLLLYRTRPFFPSRNTVISSIFIIYIVIDFTVDVLVIISRTECIRTIPLVNPCECLAMTQQQDISDCLHNGSPQQTIGKYFRVVMMISFKLV